MSDNFKNNNKNNEQAKFGLPHGYFKKSAQRIFNKIEWDDEHKEFTNLLAHKNKSGFIVPENYFETNTSTSLSVRLELLEFEKLNALTKTNAFKVPANYFESIAERAIEVASINSATLIANELIEFPTLALLKKQNKFTVPANYFLQNQEKLKRFYSAQRDNKTKVINLFSPKMWYSVAALLVIALGLWMYNSYYTLAPVNDCGTLACVDKIDLVKAKHLENIESEELYKLVNTKKLEENLEKKSIDKNNEASTSSASKMDSSLNNNDKDELLDEL